MPRDREIPPPGDGAGAVGQVAEHRLAAILSADVAGYTRLIAVNEDRTVRRLEELRALVTRLTGEHGARLVDFTGDNFLAECASAVAAVRCGRAIQAALAATNAAEGGEPMELRIGIHIGEIQVRDDRVYGDGVNIAARIQAIAEPGTLCVSDAVREQVGTKLDLAYHDLGEQMLKNVDRPVRAHAVLPGGAAVGGPGRSAPERQRARHVGRRRAAQAAVAVAGAILAAGLIWGWLRSDEAPTVEGIDSVAVLPLANLMNDPEQAYFVDGMTEALIAELARAGSLRVISRTSAMQYAETRKALPRIAEELGVDAIVEGSVLRAGDEVRITAQLIRATDDTHVWADSYERPLADVLRLQREVAAAIATAIRGAVSPQTAVRVEQAQAIDPAAHEAYLWGQHFLAERTLPAIRRAREHFEEAIAAAPELAAAHAGLADAYFLLGVYGELDSRVASERSRGAARRALELDPGSAQGHKTLGYASFAYEWDWTSAEAGLSRAVVLDPNDAGAHHWYATFLMSMGRFDEARVEIATARELDPLAAVIVSDVGLVEMMAGSYGAALAAYDDALAKAPGFLPARTNQAVTLWLSGDLDSATARLRAIAAETGDLRARALLASCLAAAGDEAAARAELERSDGGSLAIQAVALYLLGEPEEAFRRLDLAVERREPTLVSLKVWPLFDPLRSEPRFEAVMHRMGFPAPH